MSVVLFDKWVTSLLYNTCPVMNIGTSLVYYKPRGAKAKLQ